MKERPPATDLGRGDPAPGVPGPARSDSADFSKFYDHYLPRILGFALRRRGEMAAAEILTEEILEEALRAGGPLVPGPAADAAVLGAAGRVAARHAAAS
jgi:hypothetical protein